MRNTYGVLLAAGIALSLAACTRFERTMPAYPLARGAAAADPDELAGAVDRFYRAPDMDALEKAVTEAEGLDADAPETNEIAGRLALLKGDEDEAWRRFYLALASPADTAPRVHLLDILGLPLTTREYRETLALLEDIMARPADEDLRRIAAAFVASWRRRLDADPKSAEAALDTRGAIEHFALMSSFENEDGKGYGTEYPPEREIDFAKEYPGATMPARWRKDVSLSHQRNLDLGDLISPSANVTAYALTHVEVPSEGEYQLRVTTTDPIRMWVNDIEVLAEQGVESESVDQIVVPVTLREGWNKVLVKTCHGRGSWILGLGLADKGSRLVPGARSSSALQTVADGPAPGPGFSFERDLSRRLAPVKGRMRAAYLAVRMAGAAGLTTEGLDLADAYRAAAPKGLMPRLEAALSGWDTGQRGRSIDLLEELVRENGRKAPYLLVLRASHFEEQDRLDRAREDLGAAIAENPRYRTARADLADNYRAEGWPEDDLKARLADAVQWPDDTRALWGLASAYRALGRGPEAEKIYLRILDLWRGAEDILGQMVDLSLSRNDYGAALRYQKSICDIFPNMPTCYTDMGDILRRAGRYDEAVLAYRRGRAIDDRWSLPLSREGAVDYERGDAAGAVSLWTESMRMNPDDHSLADRLEFIAPDDKGLLAELAPDGDAIRKILAGRNEVKVFPGANVVFLLDHAVERAEADGSSRQIITQIMAATNETGRDQIASYSFPDGRLKVQEAYSVDPDGTRREASSLRDGEVKFRELKVGSAVVVQYRLDTHPGGYLSRNLVKRWFFHGPSMQFEDSHYLLIVPGNVKLTFRTTGDAERKDTVRGKSVIHEFRARHVAPLVAEPFSPPAGDLLDQMMATSIESWDTIAGWETALLHDAFRVTPEIEALARELTREKGTKASKLDAVTRFVMREIRYQQDYETLIAGVKPHPAPIVLQRRYGDCKDKAVLLMTLAREAGIKTRFVLLRTKGLGDFVKDIPSLQFNHAIVYVPAQDGFDAPFFIDPTPATLDLGVLPPDDQDNTGLVIDPDSGRCELVPIPFAPARSEYTLRRTSIEPVVGGTSAIRVSLTTKGPAAATLREILRNRDNTQVFVSQIASRLFPGAKVTDLTFRGEGDIVEPVELTLTLTSGEATRAQGDSVVVDLPKTESLSEFTTLAERRLPLQTGLNLSLVESEDEVALPAGYAVKNLPPDMSADNDFFTFRRSSVLEGGKVTVRMSFSDKKTRIAPAEYPAFREAVTKIIDNLKQDVIIVPETKADKRGAKVKAAKSP
ncbi:MAG: transglutaminase domain-containing protein [Deltaproteobacteria bacterium]|nr:transglutaminase domain-containing protein [Deltaproteobacteria bacterium]